MQTFLEATLKKILHEHDDIAPLILILPSKRAGGFLRHYLKQQLSKTSFAPRIISIEEFIQELSDLTIIEPAALIFKSYEAYKSTQAISEKEDFETYSSWIQTLLNDFSEIDRHLIDTQKFFSYLNSIKTLEKWNVTEQKTTLIENYLSFWESLPEFYANLKDLLLAEGTGYQGMVYRKASEDLEHYISVHADKKHIFIGFNALNNAEQHIIQELLETGNSQIFWDTDSYFIKDEAHTTASYIRSYIKHWKYYALNPLPEFPDNFESDKTIRLIEVQKNISQAKYIGEVLSSLSPEAMNNTAVVLADESLLIPLLYSLPENITTVNVTMGVPLKTFPATDFFTTLLTMHQNETEVLYYKDIQAVLNHPAASLLVEDARQILLHISKENLTHISLQQLTGFASAASQEILNILFGPWGNQSETAIQNCLELLLLLKEKTQNQTIERVVIFEIFETFNKLAVLNEDFSHVTTIKTLLHLFREMIATGNMDFQGDAYNGLQIMGLLETRSLDFENVILASVNEGILPAGKSNASFITYDLKTAFGLPLYTDKDAIYTYHFYRLIQRASIISLLYNNHSEGINTGEKSRFLWQLELDRQPRHTIEKILLAPPVLFEPKKIKEIAKTETVMERLREIALKGFSPSALAGYIRNPIDFYYQRVLRINEMEEVEETVDYNTLGTIVHDTLQAFYEPLQGSFLSAGVLESMSSQIEEEVSIQFKKTFKGGTISKGKNLIIFEVAKRYIHNLIAMDRAEVEAGNSIKIVKIEVPLTIPIDIPGIPFSVHIQGKVDRVDEYNGTRRIIDFKTGSVRQADLEIINWELITTDYKYSKAFQVLMYALMIAGEEPFQNAEAGIISCKNMSSGFLKFGTKPSPTSRVKDQQVTPYLLDLFRKELTQLIAEICNPAIPFTEKEIVK